jgi:acetyl-CoA acetyltransferase
VPAQTPQPAIVGIHNTRQARRLEGATTRGLILESIRGALDDAGLTLSQVDGVSAGAIGSTLIHDLRVGPAWQGSTFGLGMVQEAAAAIRSGLAKVVVLVAAQAGAHRTRKSTAPWTRPENEFVIPWGLFTAAEFALVARRHMEVYGTTREQLSIVAATIRNNGSANPEAVYAGRGPFKPDDIVASRPVAEPYHLLDCAMTSEGGCALVVADLNSADVRSKPVYVLGAGEDFLGPSYQFPPSWDLAGRSGIPNGLVGRRAADLAFAQAGLRREDVAVLELYDPFSFEVIRQLEAFRFCEVGEGGPYVEDGNLGRRVTTDGGLMAFSHAGVNPQMMQRVIRGVQQIRGEAGPLQVPDTHVALCSNGGAGALFTTVMLLGDEAS